MLVQTGGSSAPSHRLCIVHAFSSFLYLDWRSSEHWPCSFNGRGKRPRVGPWSCSQSLWMELVHSLLPYAINQRSHMAKSHISGEGKVSRTGKKLKVKVLVAQSCLSLWCSMDCNPPGFSVQGILQARILEWVAIPFSREPSGPRDQTCVSLTTGRFFTA